VKRTILLCGMFFIAASATAWAAPIINVGNHYFMPGITKTIALYVTDGEPVAGLNLYMQIGDGGAANGGADTTPTITDLDIVGPARLLGSVLVPATLFNSNNSGRFSEVIDLLGLASVVTASDTVESTGTLAFVTINTTGTVAGEVYPWRLAGTGVGIFGDPGVDTDFAGIPAAITNGSITIVLPGDANISGKTDVADLTLLLNNYNQSNKAWADGDFNDDGTVNVADLTLLLNNYNKTIGLSMSTPVPEPSSIVMLAGIALTALLYWWRKRS
jgi:hypothetical protein